MAMKPDHIVPAYCAGFEAIGKELPDESPMNTTWTKYTFGA